MVSCPACKMDLDIEEEEIDEGDDVYCEECGAALRVVGKNPLEVEPAEDEDEDEDADDDDLDKDGDFDEDEEEEDAEESRW